MTLSINTFTTAYVGTGYDSIQESTLEVPQDLGPVMEPDPIQFSFDSPGWYVLGIVLVFSFLLLLFLWVKRYRANAYRREALIKLNKVDLTVGSDQLGQQLAQILIILRLAAFETYGRRDVSNLHGTSWLQFLESKGKNTPFSQFEGLVVNTIYGNLIPDSQELNELKGLSIKWIQTHA